MDDKDKEKEGSLAEAGTGIYHGNGSNHPSRGPHIGHTAFIKVFEQARLKTDKE